MRNIYVVQFITLISEDKTVSTLFCINWRDLKSDLRDVDHIGDSSDTNPDWETGYSGLCSLAGSRLRHIGSTAYLLSMLYGSFILKGGSRGPASPISAWLCITLICKSTYPRTDIISISESRARSWYAFPCRFQRLEGDVLRVIARLEASLLSRKGSIRKKTYGGRETKCPKLLIPCGDQFSFFHGAKDMCVIS